MESQKTYQLPAKRQLLMKVVIVFLLIALCFLINLISGYAGGIIGCNTYIRSVYLPSFFSVFLILLAWEITAVYKNFARSLLVASLGLLVVMASATLLMTFKFVELPSDYFPLTFAYTIIGLAICTASLYVNRFAIALIDILFVKSQVLKLALVIVVVSASGVGSNIAADIIKIPTNNNVKQALLALSEAQLNTAIIVAIATGLFFGLGLGLGSWQANYRQGAPWRYPDLLRDWALAIGSFGGKSFYKLDLSGVDFRGTNLENTDLRAKNLYRTCFQGAKGLERARVDNQYLDLEIPKVQKLLTHACSADRDFRGLNLQGAYLQGADLRGFDFTDTNLTGSDLKQADLRESRLVRTQLAGADFQGVDLRKNVLIDANLTEADFRGADLRGSILVRTQVARADFRGADLTGICIEDWSVSNKTRFTDVRCDYIYRKYEDNQPTECYPVDRYFEAGEFAFLYQEPEDVVELVFKGEFDFSALSLAFYKLQTEMPELEFELKGIEQRENLWVVKAKTKGSVTERLIEAQLSLTYQATAHKSTVETTIQDSIYRDYEEIRARLTASEQLVKQLAGVTGDQAEALKELSKRSLGNSFFITGSTITNLAGSGQIEYIEAADQIRQLITNSSDPKQVTSTLRGLITQFKQQNVATTVSTQMELIQQIIGVEAEKDPGFKQFLIEQSQQVIGSMPKGEVATAVEAAIAQLRV
ncbi:MAG: pentapeptide repeat-containing protein [Nostoc sp.]|uniref:pentapeptide repeat-containing protein n=1 Tax=Nostoc sp. TaxID=1180 RepID=UPI002FF6040D